MGNIFNTKETFKKAYVEAIKKQYNVSLEDSTLTQRYSVLANLTNDNLTEDYIATNKKVKDNNMKKTIYFSMEFLMGRLITNNLHNSGVYDVVRGAFIDLGLDINEIEEREVDAGLGNGGLGRLAACFLDSAASLGLPLYGNSIRYKEGFFTQEIVNNKQVERPDEWLTDPFIWEERKEDEAIDIPFFGYIENTKLINPVWIKAVPYDVKIVGDENGVVTHLRLWSTEKSDRQITIDDKYMEMVNSISNSLYPDDSDIVGKTLRLQQQYLFSAAGVKSAINEHKALGRDILELPNFYTFQINDTHPATVIPELMRILMDEEKLGYNEAWKITTSMVAFTNHTILSEALEKWDIQIFRNLLPRTYEIIQEMDRRFRDVLLGDGRFDSRQMYDMRLIGDRQLRMANISIVGAFSVNGVAALHSDILQKIVMKDFNKLYPNKFNNKTNGVTHRRWLIHTNEELSMLLDSKIGKAWRKDLSLIKEFEQYAKDATVQKAFDKVKQSKKQQLADRILELEGVRLDVNSIFDIQVKRLHEYKRQLMNILHIIYVYQQLKTNPEFKANYYPHSFIFGAKAAPSYHMAKKVIELINDVADIVNNDNDTKHLLKLVFVENYNVTYAEYIMPAADLSEQISTASKEASGTGNMKFMLNGALTIGTLDGANVEIVEHAGLENEIIFGLTAEEVNTIYELDNYKPLAVYQNDERLQAVFSFIRALKNNDKYYDYILSNLLNVDNFLVLRDFAAYVDAHGVANELYKDRNLWLEKAIINIASAGFFSSDRTIASYNEDIWKLEIIK